MFGALKKKLQESIKGLAERARPTEKHEAEREPERAKPMPAEKPAKAVRQEIVTKPKTIETAFKPETEVKPRQNLVKPETKLIAKETMEAHEAPGTEKESLGFMSRLRAKVTEKTLTEEDIDSFFNAYEMELLQYNIALEVVDFLKQRLKESLAGKPMPRVGTEDKIRAAFREALLEIVSQGDVDVAKAFKSGNGKPCFIFLGFNGSGKTTSLAKVCRYLLDRNVSVVMAAGDSFRAASIEQLQHHGDKLGVKVIKHEYGADSAAVIFDAVKYAESHGIDVVLADTAGRTHADKNLMDELKKVMRVNQPRLKILVIDSLTGNDAVEQARRFHEAVGVDGVIMSKSDVNEKGGSVLSVCYAIRKPILFLGTGQGYTDIERFEPEKFVDELLG